MYGVSFIFIYLTFIFQWNERKMMDYLILQSPNYFLINNKLTQSFYPTPKEEANVTLSLQFSPMTCLSELSYYLCDIILKASIPETYFSP